MCPTIRRPSVRCRTASCCSSVPRERCASGSALSSAPISRALGTPAVKRLREDTVLDGTTCARQNEFVKIRRLWLPWVGGGVAAVSQGTQFRGFPVTSAATIGHAREWCQSGLALPPRAVLAILQSYRNIPYARPHPLKASRRKLSSQRHGIAARAHARVGFIARLSKVRALWRSVLHWPCFWCGVRALPADRRSLSRVSSLGGETPWKPGAVVDGTF